MSFRYKQLRQRFQRTLYYTKNQKIDQLSYPLTKLAVEYFDVTSPFDRLDEQFACDVSIEGAVSPCVFVVALVYLERLRQENKDFFQSTCPDDLYAVAVLCATKFLIDDGLKHSLCNREWATSCSKPLSQINRLEIDFLQKLSWSMMVHSEEFFVMLGVLEKKLAMEQSRIRGYCTYAELEVLTDHYNLEFLIENLLKPVLVTVAFLTAAYALACFSLLSVPDSGQLISVDMNKTATYTIPNVTGDGMYDGDVNLWPLFRGKTLVPPSAIGFEKPICKDTLWLSYGRTRNNNAPTVLAVKVIW
ncbi:Protein CNPPD1 [Trichinella patagoniensis]|uniref:Protein CNPPD1 n=1 Tax=Trichinella patagoniensis TaxID=990121 RepID=A0A0V0ZEA5_9BILA|nr:Protein CNPPD1 [Trichinella patagoniensis]